MNIEQGKMHWTPEELVELRQAAQDTISNERITQGEACRQADIPSSTFSQFLSDTYKGNTSAVAMKVARWLDALNRTKEFRSIAPVDPTFVRTPTADQVFAALQHAHMLSDLAIVVGPAGVGKTAAGLQYAKTTPRVVRVACSPAQATPTAILKALIRQIPMSGRLLNDNRSLNDRSNTVRELLSVGNLIIVDEAQHAHMSAIEELRAILDETGCGLVLMGNETVLGRIEGASRDPAYAQLFSRAGWRVVLKKGGEADVIPVLATMGVTDQAIVTMACDIARRESLRVVIKTVRAAIFLASGDNTNLAQRHIQAAYRQLGGKAA